MAKRYEIPKGKSQKSFVKGADKTPYINIAPRPLRGGIRL